jgi:hypothetical protein
MSVKPRLEVKVCERITQYLTPIAVCSSVEAYRICQKFEHAHARLFTRHLEGCRQKESATGFEANRTSSSRPGNAFWCS